MSKLKTLIGVGAVMAVAAIPAVAAGHGSGDRNRDKLPDKWERHFPLSLSVNQAGRDQDGDGLKNLSEFRHSTNPRKADTDGDGLGDRTELRDNTDPDDADTDNDGVEDGNDDSPGHDQGDDNGGGNGGGEDRGTPRAPLGAAASTAKRGGAAELGGALRPL